MRRLDEGVDQGDLERFEQGGLRGTILRTVLPADPVEESRRLLDPGCADETIHWGRNYLYRARLETPGGEVPVVVKQFRETGWRGRSRRARGEGKAQRSWRAARGFWAAGLPTPEPLALVETEKADLFVTRWVPETLEARYYLRAILAGTEQEDYPDVDRNGFLNAVGELVRQMHAAGFIHRDLSVGNVLLQRGDGPLKLWLVDLNRARLRSWIGPVARTRDLSRLRVFDRRQQQRMLDAYWQPCGVGGRVLFDLAHYGFRWRLGAKDLIRAPWKGLKQWVAPRTTHAHIPNAPKGAGVRDRIVWDALSDQPHQHAGKLEKIRVRLADLPSHVVTAATIARAVVPATLRYRSLVRDLHREPRSFGGLGIALRPRPGRLEDELAALEDLGVRRVLVRLHPWEEGETAALDLVRELHGRGFDLAFALPQVRDLVRDRARWRAAIEERAELFLPYGRAFQVGQAINRSKWGIWRYEEYFDLVRDASTILRRLDPEVRILGPAVIDFEAHLTAAILHRRPRGVFFDVVSSLLYVDRRGAPENPQLGFDTVGKVLLVRALAETARCSGSESWITEVNWPLREGPHSPAGRSVAVDEEAQADYLARFDLLALGTGAVERVYWWQLVARGYGLISDAQTTWRRRPAFEALRTLGRLEGATFHGPLSSPHATHLYRFEESSGSEVVALWSSGEAQEVTLPRPATEAWTRDGESIDPDGQQVPARASVAYYRLEDR